MLEEMKEIYGRLSDQTSRDIFEARLLYSISGDYMYLGKLFGCSGLYGTIRRMLENDPKEKVIFGMGVFGKVLVEAYQEEFGFAGFLDNHRDIPYKDLQPLTLPEVAGKHGSVTVYISVRNGFTEIKKQLLDAGMEEKDIVCIGETVLRSEEELQYFDLEVLGECRNEKEVFIDGGCYDGQTAVRFARWAVGSRRTVYAFEPDGQNIGRCADALRSLSGTECHLLRKGLWRRPGRLGFAAEGFGAKLCDMGDSLVEVDALDNLVKEKVTFIKLDIEGAEKEALEGAAGIIRRDRPRLAVCIYHKPEDILIIPEIILRMREDYRFYLRQYSIGFAEMVLYAL